jgi:hypothetical protein
MDTITIQGRVSLALTKYHYAGTVVAENLDMDLGAFAVVFCFCPNFLGSSKYLESMQTSSAFCGLWDLEEWSSQND